MRTSVYRRTIHACVRAICAALALFAFLWASNARAETDGMLRVRLTRLGAPSEITLQTDCEYRLSGEPSVHIPAGTDVTIVAEGESLTLTANGRSVRLGSVARLIRDAAGNHGVTFLSPALSNLLCGDLQLTAAEGVITATLRIYIEDYLYGVVGYEMPPSCGLEALKAQAIVARGYALRQKASRSGSAYDLSDSGDTLSYRGYNRSEKYAQSVRAVDETRGQALYYGDHLAACYFCESNGGQTEASANALGTALPYSRVMDDPYDLEGGGVKEAATLSRDASDLRSELVDALTEGMAAQLEQQGMNVDSARIAAIEGIVAESPRYAAPSLLYRSLVFTLFVTGTDAQGERDTALVTVHVPTYGGLEDWYALSINDEDNETVWVEHTDKTYTIVFRRKGTGVGMSQRGAQAMAKKGLDCQTILDYYYPGTELRTLSLSDAAQAGDTAQVSRPISVQPIATARLSQKSRLYESADDSGGALTTLPAGATVTVYDVQNEWAAVGSGDLYGYTHAQALASFTPAGAPAAQVQDETFARVSAASVEILQLPVATASPLGTLAGETSVRLTAYTDDWARIVTEDGLVGFIPRNALTLQADGDAAEGGDIVSAEEEQYALLTEDAGLYVNADDSVAPKQTLKKGLYVHILAYSSAWANVRTTDGLTGYVKLSGLSAIQQPSEKAAAEIEGGPVTVLKDKVFRYVAEETLTLYKDYSADSPVLVTLKKGEKVRLGAYNDMWACVRAHKVTGFVLLDGLTETDPAREEIEGGEIITVKGKRYAAVVADGAALYPSWSGTDEPLSNLDAGTRVRLGAYNDMWACVRVDGVTGFMRIEALELPEGL